MTTAQIADGIRASIQIEDIVFQLTGQHMNRNGKIISIYKQENNPSLQIYPDQNSFYCYSTGRGGDVIRLYADFYKISYSQAIKELGKRIGLEYEIDCYSYPQRTDRYNDPNVEKVKELSLLPSEEAYYNNAIEKSRQVDKKLRSPSSVLQANAEVMERRIAIQRNVFSVFQEFCLSQGINNEAYKYLTSNKRRLNDDIIKHYSLFSINDINDTVNHLRKNFTKDELIISGLFKDNGNFVFFRHRIIIPFYSNGLLNYVRGRYFFEGSPDTDFNKYMSPHNFSTNLYSRRLFNEDIVAKLKTAEELWICEGEFDTMVLKQVNKKAIGILGVSSIPFNRIIELYKEYKFEPIVAFDNDESGHKSIQKYAEAFPYPFHVPNFPEGIKDLTELVNYFLTYNRQK